MVSRKIKQARENALLDGPGEEIELVSRTEIKRIAEALQATGKELVELKAGDLAKIPLPAQPEEAISIARRIKSNEGLRRQMQYIGKVMRDIDAEPIQQALDNLKEGNKDEARHFHKLEGLRDDLLKDGDPAIEKVVAEYPMAERQRLRQMIKQAQKESAAKKPPAAARKLFKYLRELAE